MYRKKMCKGMKQVVVGTLYCLCVILVSCVSSPSLDGNKELPINFDNINEKYALSKYVDSVVVIPLETPDEALISNVFKVELVDDRIYLLDFFQNSLFVFDEHGKYISKVLSEGRAPDEYLRLLNFSVSNDSIYLLDYTTQSILVCDCMFKFHRRIKHSNFSSELLVTDSAVITYNEYDGTDNAYYFSEFTIGGEVNANLLKRNFAVGEYNWGSANAFAFDDSNVYLSPRYSNYIYSYPNNVDGRVLKLDFGKYNFPEKQNIDNFDITDKGFNYIVKSYYAMKGDMLFLRLTYKSDPFYCFYDIESMEYSIGFPVNDLIPGFRFNAHLYTNGYIVDYLFPHMLEDDNTFVKKYFDRLGSMDNDSNPYLILYRLK